MITTLSDTNLTKLMPAPFTQISNKIPLNRLKILDFLADLLYSNKAKLVLPMVS